MADSSRNEGEKRKNGEHPKSMRDSLNHGGARPKIRISDSINATAGKEFEVLREKRVK